MHIGRMPVYFPFPDFMHGPSLNGTTACSPALVPPVEESVYFGEWYSMPAQGECVSDAVQLPGPGS